jgi:hypothetical protein
MLGSTMKRLADGSKVSFLVAVAKEQDVDVLRTAELLTKNAREALNQDLIR